MTTSQVLAVSFDSFISQVCSELVVADDHCSGTFGDVDDVAEMVPVTVGEQDEVRLDLVSGYAGGGIVREKRIDQYFITSDFQSHCSVSVPGYGDTHINLRSFFVIITVLPIKVIFIGFFIASLKLESVITSHQFDRQDLPRMVHK